MRKTQIASLLSTLNKKGLEAYLTKLESLKPELMNEVSNLREYAEVMKQNKINPEPIFKAIKKLNTNGLIEREEIRAIYWPLYNKKHKTTVGFSVKNKNAFYDFTYPTV